MSGFTFHKSELQEYKHDNTKQYYYFFSIISREVSVKTLPQTFKLDRLETGRGRKCRSLPKVCGPTVPTRDLLALSNLQRPSAAHGSKQLFLHNNANSWPPSQVWQSRSSLVMWLSPRGTLNLHAHSSSPSDGLVLFRIYFPLFISPRVPIVFYEAVNSEVTMRVLPSTSTIRECLQYGEGLRELVVVAERFE